MDIIRFGLLRRFNWFDLIIWGVFMEEESKVSQPSPHTTTRPSILRSTSKVSEYHFQQMIHHNRWYAQPVLNGSALFYACMQEVWASIYKLQYSFVHFAQHSYYREWVHTTQTIPFYSTHAWEFKIIVYTCIALSQINNTSELRTVCIVKLGKMLLGQKASVPDSMSGFWYVVAYADWCQAQRPQG